MTKINLVEPKGKDCDSCRSVVLHKDWHIFCTKHFTREHPECSFSSLSGSKHKKCRTIQRNIPKDFEQNPKKYKPWEYDKNQTKVPRMFRF